MSNVPAPAELAATSPLTASVVPQGRSAGTGAFVHPAAVREDAPLGRPCSSDLLRLYRFPLARATLAAQAASEQTWAEAASWNINRTAWCLSQGMARAAANMAIAATHEVGLGVIYPTQVTP